MNDLYEVLEICLQDIEQGADIDTVLFRYPDLADELRPILEASRNASSLAVPAPSADVARRNRARVLQRAAQMRESKARSSKRTWFASFRRVAVTLVVVTLLFVSGTGLVRAASTTVPGDQLYPVKRTWEDVLLLLTFNSQQREALEVEHENERHHELQELFAEGRSEDVEFSGLVTSQNGNEWMVSPGITVLVSAETEIREGPIVVGSAVRVEGETQGNGAVLAEEVRLLPPGAKLPDLDDEHEGEKEDHEGGDRQEQEDSGEQSKADVPKIEKTKSPDRESEQKDESLNDGSDRGNDSASEDQSDEKSDSSDQESDDNGSHDSGEDSSADLRDSDGGGD